MEWKWYFSDEMKPKCFVVAMWEKNSYYSQRSGAKCIKTNSFDAEGNSTEWIMFDDSLMCIQNTLRRKSVHKRNWPFGKYVLIYWNWYFSHFAEQKTHKMMCACASECEEEKCQAFLSNLLRNVFNVCLCVLYFGIMYMMNGIARILSLKWCNAY